jgi:hypothetical protein
MSERRALRRRHLIYNLSVRDPRTNEEIGRLADISTGGLLLVAPRALPVGQVRDVEILPPRVAGGVLGPILASLEARWAGPDANPELCCIGCRFAGPVDETAIHQLVEFLGLDD